MSLEIFIAWRYLKARRKGVFALLTTIIAVGGITLGVASLIITLSVMSGFHKDIRSRILLLQPHITVLKKDGSNINNYVELENKISRISGVKYASGFVYGQFMMRANMSNAGLIVKGVNFQNENKMFNFSSVIEKPLNLSNIENGQIVIGRELARNLLLDVGDEVVLMSPGSFAMVPKMMRFSVAGIFHCGMFEYDSNLAYINMPDCQKLLSTSLGASAIAITLSDPEQAEKISQRITAMLPNGFYARSWERMNRSLFAALKLEKIMMFIVLTLIVIVASFNVISNLLLLTIEKSKDMGILSALGVPQFNIGKIFLFQGLMLGLSGTILGGFIGVASSLLLKKYQFVHLPADIYYLDFLPVSISFFDIFMVMGAATAITVLSSIYPSYYASKLNPLDAIRYG